MIEDKVILLYQVLSYFKSKLDLDFISSELFVNVKMAIQWQSLLRVIKYALIYMSHRTTEDNHPLLHSKILLQDNLYNTEWSHLDNLTPCQSRKTASLISIAMEFLKHGCAKMADPSSHQSTYDNNLCSFCRTPELEQIMIRNEEVCTLAFANDLFQSRTISSCTWLQELCDNNPFLQCLCSWSWLGFWEA